MLFTVAFWAKRVSLKVPRCIALNWCVQGSVVDRLVGVVDLQWVGATVLVRSAYEIPAKLLHCS